MHVAFEFGAGVAVTSDWRLWSNLRRATALVSGFTDRFEPRSV